MAEEEPNEREERLFDRQEAEKLLPLLEPLVTSAREQKKRLDSFDHELSQVQNRILLYGGLLPPYSYLAEQKAQRDRCLAALREAIGRIEQNGCVLKDLDLGLVDFPSLVNDEQVYLCWKLGEDRIRFWHRTDEGYAGRKPLSPADAPADDSKPN
jgi:hypothetical protein